MLLYIREIADLSFVNLASKHLLDECDIMKHISCPPALARDMSFEILFWVASKWDGDTSRNKTCFKTQF